MWMPSQASQAARPGQPQAADHRDRAAAGRSWRASPCRGSGTGRGGSPRSARRDVSRRVPPICIAAGATPGTGSPSLVERGEVADHERLRAPGQREVRAHPHAPGAVELRRRACGASGDACTPAAHSTVRAAMRSAPISHARRRRCRVTRAPVRTSTPSASSWRCARSRELLRVGRQDPRARPRRGRRARSRGSMRRKSRASVCRAISASAPASSTPVGPPPTTTKVSQRPRALGVLLALGRPRRRAGRAGGSRARPRASSGRARAPAHSSWPK